MAQHVIAYKVITGYLAEYINAEITALVERNKQLDDTLANRFLEYEELQKKNGAKNRSVALFQLETALKLAQEHVVTAETMNSVKNRLGMSLEERVMNHINDGWILNGGPAPQPQYNPSDSGVVWGQSIIRHEKVLPLPVPLEHTPEAKQTEGNQTEPKQPTVQR